MNRSRVTSFAVLLALGAPSAAWADSFWDFVSLNNPAQVASSTYPYGPAYNGPKSVAKLGEGSVSFSVSLATDAILFKWGTGSSNPIGEKGVGMCVKNINPPAGGNPSPGDASCSQADEIGDAGTQWLNLNLSGLTSGTVLKSFRLASLSATETYNFRTCTDATFSVCAASYTGGGNSSDVFDAFVNAGDVGAKFWQFGLFGSNTGNYLLQGMTTTVPEPGTMGLLASGLVALAGVGSLRRRNRRK